MSACRGHVSGLQRAGPAPKTDPGTEAPCSAAANPMLRTALRGYARRHLRRSDFGVSGVSESGVPAAAVARVSWRDMSHPRFPSLQPARSSPLPPASPASVLSTVRSFSGAASPPFPSPPPPPPTGGLYVGFRHSEFKELGAVHTCLCPSLTGLVSVSVSGMECMRDSK